MSLKVEHITKEFGSQKAVNDVSFEIHAGEIVGFLGPNGAGKSTTMKIITGYYNASSGHAEIDGQQVGTQNQSLKAKIGYLPEHNPLYLDMYVQEFLSFVGNIYGLKGKELSDKVEKIIDQVGLRLEAKKKIEQLSKGYRQRVGLAQALIHDPSILILDEPTTGLDPNQLVEIRALIKELGKNKTVILSTHIMQEVEAICDRVIIINKGQIVTDQKLSDLKNQYGGLENAFRTLTN
jgi:ABC-2 type transport system ATP-binding protein